MLTAVTMAPDIARVAQHTLPSSPIGGLTARLERAFSGGRSPSTPGDERRGEVPHEAPEGPHTGRGDPALRHAGSSAEPRSQIAHAVRSGHGDEAQRGARHLTGSLVTGEHEEPVPIVVVADELGVGD